MQTFISFIYTKTKNQQQQKQYNIFLCHFKMIHSFIHSFIHYIYRKSKEIISVFCAVIEIKYKKKKNINKKQKKKKTI